MIGSDERRSPASLGRKTIYRESCLLDFTRHNSASAVRWNLLYIKVQFQQLFLRSVGAATTDHGDACSRAQIQEDQMETDHADARLAKHQRMGSDDGTHA